jgi:hypothetical protein
MEPCPSGLDQDHVQAGWDLFDILGQSVIPLKGLRGKSQFLSTLAKEDFFSFFFYSSFMGKSA